MACASVLGRSIPHRVWSGYPPKTHRHTDLTRAKVLDVLATMHLEMTYKKLVQDLLDPRTARCRSRPISCTLNNVHCTMCPPTARGGRGHAVAGSSENPVEKALFATPWRTNASAQEVSCPKSDDPSVPLPPMMRGGASGPGTTPIHGAVGMHGDGDACGGRVPQAARAAMPRLRGGFSERGRRVPGPGPPSCMDRPAGEGQTGFDKRCGHTSGVSERAHNDVV